MRLIVISPEDNIPAEVNWVNQLFSAGLQYFHLRKPDYSANALKKYIEAVNAPFRERIILHSHYELIKAYGLKGMHKNSWYQYEGEIAENHQSVSCHSINEAKETVNKDYIMLSPIFNSISKENYHAAFEKEALKSFLRQSKQKVIALGGVDKGKIESCRDMGFYGVAVLGAIWQADDPVEAFKELKTLCQV